MRLNLRTLNLTISLIDDNPPDNELIQHLSSALLYISQSDFEKLFNEHKYALSQIQLMTPHSLTILNDSINWPIFNIGNYQTSGDTITSEWSEKFSEEYIRSRGFNINTQMLVKHCVNELYSKGFISAVLCSDDHANVRLTDIGQTIKKYIDS